VLARAISFLPLLALAARDSLGRCEVIVPDVHTTPSLSLTLIFSKALSAGVIGGSMLGKMPQVYDVWMAKSAAGLSRVSIWTETASLGIQFAYNVVRQTPWYTFAEVPILFVQLLLLGLVAAYVDGQLNLGVLSLGTLMTSLTVAMAVRLVPTAVTLALFSMNALMGLGIILPQIVLNCQNHSTGQLSFIVTAMTFGGTSARLFTTLVGVDDLPLRLTIGLNWCLVAVLTLQFVVLKPEQDFDEAELDDEPSVHLGMHEPLSLDRRRSFSKSIPVLQALSAVGSSRCLLTLAQTDTAWSAEKFRAKRSFNSFGQLPIMSQDWRRTASETALYRHNRAL